MSTEAHEIEEQGEFVCDVVLEDGSKCNKVFKSLQALLLHKKRLDEKGHNYEVRSNKFVITNC